MLQRGAADVGVVVERLAAERSVDHQRDLAIDHAIDDVRPLVLMDFPGQAGLDAVLLEKVARTGGGDDAESEDG